MFVCIECAERYEGSSIDYVKMAYPGGTSYGPCEFCEITRGCFDLYSGDKNWYPKNNYHSFFHPSSEIKENNE